MRRTASRRRSCNHAWARAVLVGLLVAPGATLRGAPIDGSPAEPAKDALPAPLEAIRELPRSRPGITLFVFDVKGLIGGQLTAFAGETSAIFKEMGVELGFRSAGLGTVFGDGQGREIPVIVVDKPRNSVAVAEDVLGLVPKDAGTAVWIFVDHIRRAAGIRDSGRPDADRALAVAAGRVVAHELVHALLPTLAHTKSGLMRSSLDQAALSGRLRPSLADCAAAVRTALAPASAALLQRPALVAGGRNPVAY